MKRYLLKKMLFMAIAIMAMFPDSLAQSPSMFSYQAIVRDASSEPLVNSSVTVTFDIRQGAVDGTIVYSETHATTTNNYGLLTLQIGTGTTGDNFSAIDWSTGSYFLSTDVDGNDMGTTRLISVPYSLFSDRAGNVFSGDYNDLSNKPDLSGFLTSETDPLFAGSPASGITTPVIGQWNQAYSWGNHASAGYLSVESDPVFISSPAFSVSNGSISNWNTAYGWGNHAAAGYITGESDPVYSLAPASSITTPMITQWNQAYSWGNHASAGYLSVESDPVFISSPAFSVSNGSITNWNTAYGWGNHATAGYLSTESDPVFISSPAFTVSTGSISNWNTAYGWGNHAAAGYDPSSTNELQALSLVGNDLTLSGSVPTVDLSAYMDASWTRDKDTLYYLDGNVGVGTNDPKSTLSVVGSTPNDEAIFEVRNNNGTVVFAVYEDGVQVNIDETVSKGPRGGFAVGGFDATKGFTDYMNITGDSIRLYIDNSAAAKGPRGGFAVGGFDKSSKATPTRSFMTITGEEDLTTGYNTFLGYEAGGDGGGENNTAIGYYAGYNIANARNNVLIGDSAGMYLSSGYENIMIGRNAGAHAGGYNNVLIGYRAGSEGWSQYNVMIGNEAGRYNQNGVANVFVGTSAGRGVTDGYGNTLIGTQAGQVLGSGDNNTFLGTSAGFNTVDALSNTFVGSGAGRSNDTGSNNLYVGASAGSQTKGSSNIILGNSWGPASGTNNIMIGHHSAGYYTSNLNYQMVIDYRSEADINNSFIVGNMQLDQLRFNARTGIRTAPEAGFDLTVLGAIKAESVSTPSDIRLKTNIMSYNNPLQKMLGLRGVTYNWNESYKDDPSRHIGFIAQEAMEIIPELVNSTGEYMSISYAPVTALLVEAVKELKKENDELKARLDRIDKLEAELEELKSLLKQK